ncbi:hypothetical protein LCGC14_2181880, partial [marine sediment metagenome]
REAIENQPCQRLVIGDGTDNGIPCRRRSCLNHRPSTHIDNTIHSLEMK